MATLRHFLVLVCHVWVTVGCVQGLLRQSVYNVVLVSICHTIHQPVQHVRRTVHHAMTKAVWPVFLVTLWHLLWHVRLIVLLPVLLVHQIPLQPALHVCWAIPTHHLVAVLQITVLLVLVHPVHYSTPSQLITPVSNAQPATVSDVTLTPHPHAPAVPMLIIWTAATVYAHHVRQDAPLATVPTTASLVVQGTLSTPRWSEMLQVPALNVRHHVPHARQVPIPVLAVFLGSRSLGGAVSATSTMGSLLHWVPLWLPSTPIISHFWIPLSTSLWAPPISEPSPLPPSRPGRLLSMEPSLPQLLQTPTQPTLSTLI